MGQISNIPALVQIMAWRRWGDKPLSEPMMVNFPTHMCVTRPQWVTFIRIIHLILPWFRSGLDWNASTYCLYPLQPWNQRRCNYMECLLCLRRNTSFMKEIETRTKRHKDWPRTACMRLQGAWEKWMDSVVYFLTFCVLFLNIHKTIFGRWNYLIWPLWWSGAGINASHLPTARLLVHMLIRLKSTGLSGQMADNVKVCPGNDVIMTSGVLLLAIAHGVHDSSYIKISASNHIM